MGFRRFAINKYEPWEDEKRLEELAAKGEFICAYALGIAYFKKKEPKNLRYSVEAAALRPHGRKRRFYKENGWRLVCRGSDTNIFANEDAEAMPIHTDRSEYAHVIERFYRYMRGILIMLLVMAFIIYSEMAWIFPLLTHEKIMCFADYFRYFPQPLSWMISVYWLIYTGMTLFGLKDLIGAGRFIAGNIESGTAAGRAVLWDRILTVIVVLTAVLGAVSIGWLWLAEITSKEYPADISDLPGEAVTIGEFFPEEGFHRLLTQEDIEKYIASPDMKKTAEPMADKAMRYTSPVTEEYYEYTQYGAYEGGYASVWGKYIIFLTESMADTAADDVVRYQKEVFVDPRYDIVNEFNPQGTAFDRVTAISSDDTPTVVFVLRKGRALTVLNVHVSDSELTVGEMFKNFPIFEKIS